MVVTEEEAREKWCPQVRNWVSGGWQTGINRNGSDIDYERFKCIASDCMMWRKADHGFETSGYCGLAGEQ